MKKKAFYFIQMLFFSLNISPFKIYFFVKHITIIMTTSSKCNN